ncbi:MAG: hypothetical protein J6L02_04225 [Bacteroidales bacterium]|nr:hypothetical protein [Bacteroidales bacterium]
MRNILYSNYFSKENINLYYLSQHVEYSINGKDVMFYNTLFDSLLLANFKSNESALRFIKELEKGIHDVLMLINDCFDKDAESIYTLLVLKKIIE